MTISSENGPQDHFAEGTNEDGGIAARLWRQRKRFAVVFGGVFALAVGAYVVTPVSYLASGSIIVAEADPGQSNPSAVWGQKIGDPADLESQLLVVHSPRVIRLATAQPGVAEAVRSECKASGGFLQFGGDVCDKLQPESDAIVNYLQDRYSVGAVGRSRVITVAYKSSKAEIAQTLANALITAFLEDQKSNLSSGREFAATWLWKELKQLDAELKAEDAKIQEFRADRGLARGSAAPISSERLTSIGQQLSAAETAQAAAAARLEEVRVDQRNGTANAPAVLASRAVADLKQQLTVIGERMAAAEMVLGPRHPQYTVLRAQVDALRQRLSVEVSNILSSSEKEHSAAVALVASLRKQMGSVKSEVAVASADEASIETMVRNAEIKRRQYADLYEKASSLETERRVLLGSTRLVSLAELPAKPFFPKKVPFLAAGLTLAGLAAAAAALHADRANGRAPVPGPVKGSTPVEEPRPVRAAEDAPKSRIPSLRSLLKRDDKAGAAPVAPATAAAFVAAMAPAGSKADVAPVASVEVAARPEAASRSAVEDGVLVTLPVPMAGGRGSGADRLARALAAIDHDAEANRALRKLHRALLRAERADTERALTVMVCAPTAHEGKCFTSLALARSAAQAGHRVLLIETDLKAASFAAVLKVQAAEDLGGYLRGEIAPEEAVTPTGAAQLDLIAADRLTLGGTTARAGSFRPLLDWASDYDLVIVDAPSSATPQVDPDLLLEVDGVLVSTDADDVAIRDGVIEAALIEREGGTVFGVVATRQTSGGAVQAEHRARAC